MHFGIVEKLKMKVEWSGIPSSQVIEEGLRHLKAPEEWE